jgi:hypothetical protein
MNWSETELDLATGRFGFPVAGRRVGRLGYLTLIWPEDRIDQWAASLRDDVARLKLV